MAGGLIASSLRSAADWISPKKEVQNYGYVPIASNDFAANPLFFTDSFRVMSREVASSYATLFRCMLLISGSLADLITKTVRVVDYEGREVLGSNAKRVISLLRESADGTNPSIQFLRDMVIDFLLDGNSLALIDRNSKSQISKLRRLNGWGASAHEVSGGWYYQVTFADSEMGESMEVFQNRIIHARYPKMSRTGSYSGRGSRFATPPLMVLRRALDTGIAADEFVRQYFDAAGGGSRSRLAISYDVAPEGKDAREAVINYIGEYVSKSRSPLVLFGGGKPVKLGDTPQDNDALKLREFQVLEIARAFGVPAPLIGQNTTQWGSGIEQLSKMFWTHSAKHYLNDILEPMSLLLLPRGQKLAVQESEIFSGDTDAVTKLVQTAAQHGLITREEARKRLGFTADMQGEPLQPPGYAAGMSGNGAGAKEEEPAMDEEKEGEEEGEKEDGK